MRPARWEELHIVAPAARSAEPAPYSATSRRLAHPLGPADCEYHRSRLLCHYQDVTSIDNLARHRVRSTPRQLPGRTSTLGRRDEAERKAWRVAVTRSPGIGMTIAESVPPRP